MRRFSRRYGRRRRRSRRGYRGVFARRAGIRM